MVCSNWRVLRGQWCAVTGKSLVSKGEALRHRHEDRPVPQGAASRHTDVQAHRPTGAQAHRHTGARAHRRTDTQVHWAQGLYPRAHGHAYMQVQRHTAIQAHRHTGTWHMAVYRRTGRTGVYAYGHTMIDG